jgi:cell wall-associated NlpC family hydrolase
MDLLIRYAMSMAGTPYAYGGNNVLQGIDCSGFVCEVLRFAGLVGNKEDLTAQQLFDKFEQTGTVGVFAAGALAFYGSSLTKISHVAFMVDAHRILEAGGGDSTTHSVADAAKRNALVRGRLAKYRADFLVTVKPRYATIGLI